jgi:hypothetical protein
MNAAEIITIRCDPSPFIAALEQLSEIALEVGDGLLGFPKFVEEVGCVNFDVCSAGANELLVRLEPSDAFLRFGSALRARNSDVLAVEHIDSPAGVDNRRMAEGGGARNAPAGGR